MFVFLIHGYTSSKKVSGFSDLVVSLLGTERDCSLIVEGDHCFSLVITAHRQDGTLERVFKACFHIFVD